MIEARLHEEFDLLGLLSYHGAPWDYGNTTFYADLTQDDIEKIRELLRDAGRALASRNDVAAMRKAQDEAHSILATTIATENGRTFPTRVEFARCLDFLARLSGDDQWGFLIERGDGV